ESGEEESVAEEGRQEEGRQEEENHEEEESEEESCPEEEEGRQAQGQEVRQAQTCQEESCKEEKSPQAQESAQGEEALSFGRQTVRREIGDGHPKQATRECRLFCFCGALMPRVACRRRSAGRSPAPPWRSLSALKGSPARLSWPCP